MSDALRITIVEDRREVHSEEYSEPVELGRQDRDDHEVYRGRPKDGRVRVPVARKHETAVSTRQALVEALPEGMVRLTNQSQSVSIRLLEDKSELTPKSSQDLPLPQTLLIGPRVVRIEAIRLESLAEAPLPPGRAPDHSLLGTSAADHTPEQQLANPAFIPRALVGTSAADRTPEGDSLIDWLQATIDVQHRAATALDCYDRATDALVNMLGLDAGRVLLREGGDWRVKAQTSRATQEVAPPPRKPSTRALKQLVEEKKTCFGHVRASLRNDSLVGVEAWIAAPILDRQGNVIGALYGDRGEEAGAGPVTELQATLVQLLASGVAAGLSQKKLVKMERELEIGREIQAHFLPEELPQVQGWEVAAHFRPAYEVSGDFYDVFALPGSHLALVIADVCDKGVGAALYMTLLRSLLRAFAEQAGAREPFGPAGPHASTPDSEAPERRTTLLAESITRSAVELTNNYVAQTHGRHFMFCTLFFGVLDTASGKLTYINAGHHAPALLRAAGIKARLTRTGPLVGIKPNISYGIDGVLLEPGDTLFAYTDGVTEARDPVGQFFTEERLVSILQQPAPSAKAAVDNVVASLHEHIAGADPHDDVTMLAVRRMP